MYSHEWYLENKERLKEIRRQYRLKNKERISEKGKEWSKNHPENGKIYWKRRKEKLKILVGDSCYLCGDTRWWLCHEKYGKKHPSSLTYIRNHREDFVRLCPRCHNAIHRYVSAVDKEKFEELVNLIINRQR